ncbi:MAG: hypothetical protein HFH31_02490 [Bacilli bacterium]|nr:hypothetical protein [Bacilli bacterium]
MNINVIEKENELLKILESIEFLEKQIEDTTPNYYISLPIRVNGILITTSIFQIIQTIILFLKMLIP